MQTREPLSMNPTTFAPETVPTRKMPRRMSGFLLRLSITRKATRSAAEPTRHPIVCAEPQPAVGALESAYTSRTSEVVMAMAPNGSNERAPSRRLSRTKRGVSRNTSTPTGTLMKKIHSQPRYEVSTPPRSTPAAAPAPAIAP